MTEALFNRAVTAFQAGDPPQAEQLCLAILKADARNSNVLHLLGMARFQMGRLPSAIETMQQALAVNPAFAPVWSNLGMIQASAGQHEAALVSLERSLTLAPPQAETLVNLGNVLQALGRDDEALKRFDAALWLKPDMAEGLIGRGNVYRALEDYERSLADLDRLLALAPNNPQALHNRALALSGLGRHEEALASSDRALALRPDAPATHSNRADVLMSLKRYDEALAACDRALTLAPRFGEAMCNRGAALTALGRLEEAMASYDVALTADANLAEAHGGKSEVLRLKLRYAPALDSLDRALALKPKSAWALRNRGVLLSELERQDEALASFDASAVLAPGDPDTGFNKALVLLLQGNFAEGLPLYEERKRIDPPLGLRHYPQPSWTGAEAIQGKTLFLYYEQGLGDIIMFSRFVAPVAALGAHVVLEVPEQLQALFQGFVSDAQIVTAAPEQFDFHAPLASLMLALKTKEETIPALPYLKPDPARVEAWRGKLGGEGFRIGIAWQGARGAADHGRSFPVAAFAPLAAIPGVRLISLQKGDGADQLVALPTGMNVETLGEEFDAASGAFVDTAAVMASLDLVISSDTAIAHLAGALGRPLWVALRHKPEWRWQLSRADSPWYPGATLFRQPSSGDWNAVFAAMTAKLLTNPALKPPAN